MKETRSPHAIPRWWRDIPWRRQRRGLTRGGVGGERGTSDIPGTPGPPGPRKRGAGGREGPAKRNQASAAERTKQDFRKQTQTQTHRHRHGHASLGARKEKKETLGPPKKRKQNSTWVEAP